jgi:cyclase
MTVDATLRELPLSPRLLLLTLGGDAAATSYGTNCLALAGRDATLLVDPLIAPAHARLVEAAVRRRGLPPVRHVVLTHHHTDHALGAGFFARRGAIVLAHRRCAALMAAQHAGLVAARRRIPALAALFADAEPHAPAALFDDAADVDLGGGVVAEVRHLGHGHTAGDAVVCFPSEDFVAVGDLVFDGYHFNYEESDVGALPRRLDEVAALSQAFVVPGHGAPGGRELLERQRAYHRDVAAIVRGSPTPGAARAAILARFPGLALEEAVESAIVAHAPIRR